jgi:HAE1 family hydrophobic/amphiphilic exporter-1
VPGIQDLTSDLEVTSPQVNVEIDRDKAARRRRHRRARSRTRSTTRYGPRWVSTIYAPVNEYKVLLELAPQFQADPRRCRCSTSRATGRWSARLRCATAAADRAADRHHYGQLLERRMSFGLTPARRSAVPDARGAGGDGNAART